MNIFLIINTDKPSCIAAAKIIADTLSKFPCKILTEIGNEKIDIAVTVGGDGTLLHAADMLSKNNIPVVGINLGRLGYLTELEASEIDKLSMLFDAPLKTEERMMLEFNVYRGSVKVNSFTALNDGVISKGALSRLVELELFCGKNPVTSYRADGLIISTPTGSTAYSLSAGGPVVAPGLQVIGITPICAHTMATRPIIFGADADLFIRIPVQRLNEIYLSIDGDNTFPLSHLDEIYIKKSKRTLKTIRLKDNNFYHTLNAKFSGGESL